MNISISDKQLQIKCINFYKKLISFDIDTTGDILFNNINHMTNIINNNIDIVITPFMIIKYRNVHDFYIHECKHPHPKMITFTKSIDTQFIIKQLYTKFEQILKLSTKLFSIKEIKKKLKKLIIQLSAISIYINRPYNDTFQYYYDSCSDDDSDDYDYNNDDYSSDDYSNDNTIKPKIHDNYCISNFTTILDRYMYDRNYHGDYLRDAILNYNKHLFTYLSLAGMTVSKAYILNNSVNDSYNIVKLKNNYEYMINKLVIRLFLLSRILRYTNCGSIILSEIFHIYLDGFKAFIDGDMSSVVCTNIENIISYAYEYQKPGMVQIIYKYDRTIGSSFINKYNKYYRFLHDIIKYSKNTDIF